MTRPRIYLPRALTAGDRYPLADRDRQYLGKVLRLGGGDRILLFDGRGREGEGEIHVSAAGDWEVAVLESWIADAAPLSLILAQALPKAGKMDLILQKATELGVDAVHPFASQRSVPRLDPDKAGARRERWQKIAMEAARQCRRASLPAIHPVVPFERMLEMIPRDAFRILCWEEEKNLDIRTLLGKGPGEASAVCVVIGPEGGFTAEERAAAQARGFASASLGPRLLKVETAVLAILALVQYEWGGFFNLPGGTQA